MASGGGAMLARAALRAGPGLGLLQVGPGGAWGSGTAGAGGRGVEEAGGSGPGERCGDEPGWGCRCRGAGEGPRARGLG